MNLQSLLPLQPKLFALWNEQDGPECLNPPNGLTPKSVGDWGFVPDPTGGAYSAPQTQRGRRI